MTWRAFIKEKKSKKNCSTYCKVSINYIYYIRNETKNKEVDK